MTKSFLAILVGAIATLGTPAAAASADLKVRWHKKSYSIDELPEEMPEAARLAVNTWSTWAIVGKYRMDLEDEGRVLLISPERSSSWKSQMKLVERTMKVFDGALPAPERAAVEPARPTTGPDTGGEDPLPEDPDDEPLPEDPDDEGSGRWKDDGAGTPYTSWSTAWGTETAEPLDTETVVMFVVKSELDFTRLLSKLGTDHPYLTKWIEKARKYTGFTLEKPLAGAFVMGASGQNEWNPDNELVNRVAQLLLIRRFGQLPYWFVQGWAWSVELDLLKALYCFPYRDEFVWATEHSSWPSELAKAYQGREEDPVTISEFASWRRGKYDDARARVAWGMTRFLYRHRRGSMTRIAEELRLFREADNRVDHADGTWDRRLDYEVPLHVQIRILTEEAGEDLFSEATKFFLLGDRYDG